jgi:hypothetical protein
MNHYDATSYSVQECKRNFFSTLTGISGHLYFDTPFRFFDEKCGFLLGSHERMKPLWKHNPTGYAKLGELAQQMIEAAKQRKGKEADQIRFHCDTILDDDSKLKKLIKALSTRALPMNSFKQRHLQFWDHAIMLISALRNYGDPSWPSIDKVIGLCHESHALIEGAPELRPSDHEAWASFLKAEQLFNEGQIEEALASATTAVIILSDAVGKRAAEKQPSKD